MDKTKIKKLVNFIMKTLNFTADTLLLACYSTVAIAFMSIAQYIIFQANGNNIDPKVLEAFGIFTMIVMGATTVKMFCLFYNYAKKDELPVIPSVKSAEQ